MEAPSRTTATNAANNSASTDLHDSEANDNPMMTPITLVVCTAVVVAVASAAYVRRWSKRRKRLAGPNVGCATESFGGSGAVVYSAEPRTGLSTSQSTATLANNEDPEKLQTGNTTPSLAEYNLPSEQVAFTFPGVDAGDACQFESDVRHASPADSESTAGPNSTSLYCSDSGALRTTGCALPEMVDHDTSTPLTADNDTGAHDREADQAAPEERTLNINAAWREQPAKVLERRQEGCVLGNGAEVNDGSSVIRVKELDPADEIFVRPTGASVPGKVESANTNFVIAAEGEQLDESTSRSDPVISPMDLLSTRNSSDGICPPVFSGADGPELEYADGKLQPQSEGIVFGCPPGSRHCHHQSYRAMPPEQYPDASDTFFLHETCTSDSPSRNHQFLGEGDDPTKTEFHSLPASAAELHSRSHSGSTARSALPLGDHGGPLVGGVHQGEHDQRPIGSCEGASSWPTVSPSSRDPENPHSWDDPLPLPPSVTSQLYQHHPYLLAYTTQCLPQRPRTIIATVESSPTTSSSSSTLSFHAGSTDGDPSHRRHTLASLGYKRSALASENARRYVEARREALKSHPDLVGLLLDDRMADMERRL